MGASESADEDLCSAIRLNDFPQFCHLLRSKGPTQPLHLRDFESRPTVLHLLCLFGRLHMLETLSAVFPCVSLDTPDDFGDTPLITAVKIRSSAVVSHLLASGASANVRNELDDRDSPLHYASLEGDLSTVRALLAAGAEVDAPNQHRMTPLMYAVQAGHSQVAQLLTTAGADPALRDRRDKSARDYGL